MRLLVVGASGLIGQEVCRVASEQGIKTIGTATDSWGGKFIPYRLEQDSPYDLIRMCGFENKEPNTYAVLAGAMTNIEKCRNNEGLAEGINVRGMCNLAEELHSNNIKSIFLSSDAVFDGARGTYSEEDLPHPICKYGEQKLKTENYLLSHISDILIYRLSKQVDATIESPALFGDLFRQYQQRNVIRCISGLIFNPTYVRDTAICIIKGLTAGLNGVFHVANPEVFSRYEIAKLFFAKKSIPVTIVEERLEAFNFTEEKPLNTTLNTFKFRKALKYEFQTMGAVISKMEG